jgi:squalene monooxygenase
MIDTANFDVIVGGGGIAGTAVAAALQQLDYQILLVEPGQYDERRLAGEVFHPPGVTALAELGLLPPLSEIPAVTINGFFVSCGDNCIRLPYDAVPAHRGPGLCLEHSLIRERMLATIGTLPKVTLNRGGRVVGIDQSDPSHLVVEVREGTRSQVYRCRMLVIADGSPSRLACLAGIDVYRRRISTVWGYRLTAENLPPGGFCQVFLGAATPILFYPIGNDGARILFDFPYESARPPTVTECLALAETLPGSLRSEVTHVIRRKQRMSVLAQAITTRRVVSGRAVLVGDAGGCCHPLTATGMTRCVSDALLLRNALVERHGDFPAALQLYQRRRRWPQATRLVLADALRDAFTGTSPESRVMRNGVFALWRDRSVGRSATLALLSTADGRPLALMRQMIAAMARGFLHHIRHPSPADRGHDTFSIVWAILAILFRRIRQVLIVTTPTDAGPTEGQLLHNVRMKNANRHNVRGAFRFVYRWRDGLLRCSLKSAKKRHERIKAERISMS